MSFQIEERSNEPYQLSKDVLNDISINENEKPKENQPAKVLVST